MNIEQQRAHRSRLGLRTACGLVLAAALASTAAPCAFASEAAPAPLDTRLGSCLGPVFEFFRSSVMNHPVSLSSNGTSLNVFTQALDDAGPLQGDWHLNFWPWPPDGQLGFYGIATCVAAFVTGPDNRVAALHPHDVVGPASTFAPTGEDRRAAAEWLAGTDAYAGFRFFVEGAPYYGYVRIRTNAPVGFPATLVEYAYQAQPISVGFPERIFCGNYDPVSDNPCR